MPTIELSTWISAPRARGFDLSLSIDLHRESMAHTGERAVAGVTSGLIGLGETVTWEARHLGWKHRLQVRIVELERPVFFVDESVRGPFRRMQHRHLFHEETGGTRMLDRFEYAAPGGWLGRLAERTLLTRHLCALLEERNRVLRQAAETEAWRRFLTAGAG